MNPHQTPASVTNHHQFCVSWQFPSPSLKHPPGVLIEHNLQNTAGNWDCSTLHKFNFSPLLHKHLAPLLLFTGGVSSPACHPVSCQRRRGGSAEQICYDDINVGCLLALSIQHFPISERVLHEQQQQQQLLAASWSRQRRRNRQLIMWLPAAPYKNNVTHG